MNNLENKIEAILFFKGESVTRKRLAEILKASQTELNEAIEALKEKLSTRGIVMLERENEITLGTAPEHTKLIEELQKDELNRELSKASLETLSIILYKGSASRADIDYIRGVNSNFILRALSVRGLVERVLDPEDARRYIYKPTFDLMQYMGIKSVEELPEWGDVNKGMQAASEQSSEAS